MNRTLVLVAAALLAGRCLAAAPVIGRPAPDFVVRQLDDSLFDLAALRGKVVILNFWATWCPPCRTEMPILEEFYADRHAQGVELIGVSIDRPQDADEVRKVMRSFTYRAALISAARVNRFGSPEALPVTWVIDRDGIVRGKLRADGTPVTRASLDAVVLPLLGGEPAREGSGMQ